MAIVIGSEHPPFQSSCYELFRKLADRFRPEEQVRVVLRRQLPRILTIHLRSIKLRKKQLRGHDTHTEGRLEYELWILRPERRMLAH